MSAEFYLEKFAGLGLGELAEKVRHSLPSVAKTLLTEAIRKNELDYQEALAVRGYGTSIYTRREDVLKGALRGLTNR